MSSGVVRRAAMAGSAAVVVLALVVVIGVPLVSSATAPRVAKRPSQFCSLVAGLGSSVPATTAAVDSATAISTATRLRVAAKRAPWTIQRSMRRMATVLRSLAVQHGPSTIVATPTLSGTYSSDFAVFTSYREKYCPASLPVSPNLPGVQAARDAACVADAQTIQLAEGIYSGTSSVYASMEELVSSGLLRSVSSFYSEVRLDDPPGGYTLVAVANGPCANLPHAG